MSLRKLLSKLQTSIAYDGGAAAREANMPAHKVTLQPGVNLLEPRDVEVLEIDKHFRKHMEAGHFVALPDEQQPQEDPAPDVVADPRARMEGESPAAHKKRVKALDEAAEARAPVLDAYFAADDEARVAMLPTLDDDTKAAIEADERNKPKED